MSRDQSVVMAGYLFENPLSGNILFRYTVRFLINPALGVTNQVTGKRT